MRFLEKSFLRAGFVSQISRDVKFASLQHFLLEKCCKMQHLLRFRATAEAEYAKSAHSHLFRRGKWPFGIQIVPNPSDTEIPRDFYTFRCTGLAASRPYPTLYNFGKPCKEAGRTFGRLASHVVHICVQNVYLVSD